MLELCLLGTGGMLPLPYRALTSLMVRYNGSSILIDCGEGTQNQIRLQGWSFKPIDVICITHFHADHISGLPGMLLTMGNAERTEPLTMIGPRGLEHVVNSLRIIAPELPFEIKFIELEQPEEVIEICGLRIRAFRVNHRVTCYGYNIELDRAGKFDAARARALGLPVQYWSLLQKGETVDYEGNVYTSDMVMGSPRKGLKVTYCTDTRPVDAIAECAKDADLFICCGSHNDKNIILENLNAFYDNKFKWIGYATWYNEEDNKVAIDSYHLSYMKGGYQQRYEDIVKTYFDFLKYHPDFLKHRI